MSTPQESPLELQSVLDLILNGGPLMIPIALCSVVALAYTVERALRLRGGALAPRAFDRELTSALSDSPGAAGELCNAKNHALARIFGAAFGHVSDDGERGRRVEEAGRRELRRLSANLRPLVVVAMIAPLLGLLGTVWGMIEAFSDIALKDGIGKPELLAGGISQALVTTAAGLSVAIPAQVAFYALKGRVDRFARRTEDLWLRVEPMLARPAVTPLLGGGDPA